MGRRKKSPIEFSPVLERYLKDIRIAQNKRDKNKNLEPKEMFLIYTLKSKESLSENHMELLDNFKKYFEREKILKFPKLKEFADKYNFDWTAEDVMDFAEIDDEGNTATFEKFFPVKVLDFERLTNFIDTYSTKSTGQKNKEEEVSGKTAYRLDTKTLKKDGLPTHEFRGEKYRNKTATLRIFEELWGNRRHLQNGKVLKAGNGVRFDLFTKNAGLVVSIDELRGKNKTDSLMARIRGVVKNLTREGYDMSLTCTRNEVLLTVKD